MPFLMCKDTPIYNIHENIILNAQLVPRQFTSEQSFKRWKRTRQFVVSNAASRDLAQSTPSEWIEKKRQLSLSDCYWIKYDGDNITFSDVTPYLNPFTSLSTIARNSSIPGLTLAGSFTKEWTVTATGERVMRKAGFSHHTDAECAAYALSQQLGIPCNIVERESDTVVIVHNMTNLDWMLISYAQLGITVNGYSPKQIASPYPNKPYAEYKALILVLFDAIVGNNDRFQNMGNLAIYKNANTGELEFPPSFDFNMAHPNRENFFLGHISKTIKTDGYAQQAVSILRNWQNIPNTIWEHNRKSLISLLLG